MVGVAVMLAAPAFAAPDPARIEAGRYQAILADCIGCHTAPGGKAFAGGVLLDTPFGKLATPNITPDKATGLGNWSAADFRAAVKTGMAPGGRRLYPAMPYPAYARISDADLNDLWAYLQSLAPVRNPVNVNQLAFPFNIRGLMAGWNWLYFKTAAIQPQPGKSAAFSRGEYLVNGPGHCGACHTPKNLFGADTAAALTGSALQGWFAPDITAAPRRGIGGWHVSEVVTYLKTGHNSHAMATGPMAEVIENSTALMRDADLAAIATYLTALPGDGAAPAPLSAGDARMKEGALVYDSNCRGCHNSGGGGQSLIFPPLAANPVVQQQSADSLIRVVLAGTQSAQTARAPTAAAMPSFAWRLNDVEVAAVLTYIRNAWGNAAAPVSPDAVTKTRRSMPRH